MFCTLVFLVHSPDLCLALEHIIHGCQTCTLINLTNCVLVSITSFIDLTMMVGIKLEHLFSSYDRSLEYDLFYHN